MKDRIEEIFQQVMNEACPDPLRRFAELVAEDAVAKEREACAKLCEFLAQAGLGLEAIQCAIAIRKPG